MGKPLFSYDNLVHAISGAVGSSTAMAVFYPLEIVRSRLQVEDDREARKLPALLRELAKEEGIGTLYRGMLPVLQSICCSNFVYFYSFHCLRSLWVEEKSHTALRDLLLAAVAGSINVLTTTPLWVVNTRIKMQGTKLAENYNKIQKRPHYNGILDGLIKISQLEGLPALWSGTIPSLVLVLNPAIQFMVYEFLKRQAEKRSLELGSLSFFAMGAIAKCISTIVTYPLQVLQSKLRYGTKELQRKNLLQMMLYLIHTRGVLGLYKGLEAKLWQTVLTSALMFLFYEKIVAFVFTILKARGH